MNTELNEQLERSRKQLDRFHEIESLLPTLTSKLEALRQKESELKAQLQKENADVSKLEKKNLKSLFYTIRGNLEQQLAQEQNEAVVAKYHYEQILRDLSDLDYQIETLSSEREQYRNAHAEYDRLWTQKKEHIIQESEQMAQQIIALDTELKQHSHKWKETKEALSAGNAALASLDKVQDFLKSAANWGKWDMFGGGLLADIEKHSKLDAAKNKLSQSQQLLCKFNEALSDILISSDITIEIDGFSKFADFFFDGLFADWNMQTKINQSTNDVLTVMNEVKQVIAKLEEMKLSAQLQRNQVNAQLDSLIRNAT